MQKVVIYSPTARKGCEKIDLSLVNELISRNFSVTYAVTSNKMFLNKKFDFYGFQEKFKLDKDFQKNKTIWIEYFNDLKKIILNHDIFITGSHCSPKLTSFAKKTGKIIIQHFNPHNYDLSLKQLKADLLCTQGYLPNKILLSKILFALKNKNLSKIKKKFLITGSLHFDEVHNEINSNENYNEFCKKYNLDPKKELILFLPTGPQHHDEFYQERYKKICNIIEDSGFNLLIKGHPSDYAKKKIEIHYSKYFKNNSNDKSSWDFLVPDKKVCKPEDFNIALKNCKTVVSIFTRVYQEVSLFNKPTIFVDRFASMLNMYTDTNKKVRDNFTISYFEDFYHEDKIGVYEYGIPDKLYKDCMNYHQKGLIDGTFLEDKLHRDCNDRFFGEDIKLVDLKKTLTNLKIPEHCKDLNILKNDIYFKNDGKSYLRIANAVENLVKNHKVSLYSRILYKIRIFIQWFILTFLIFNFYEDFKIYLFSALKKFKKNN